MSGIEKWDCLVGSLQEGLLFGLECCELPEFQIHLPSSIKTNMNLIARRKMLEYMLTWVANASLL